jgi:hypothetical protein
MDDTRERRFLITNDDGHVLRETWSNTRIWGTMVNAPGERVFPTDDYRDAPGSTPDAILCRPAEAEEAKRLAGWTTKDSGKREEMPTGSVRDSREGKGRYDLVSPFALRRLAGVYERGAKKYDARNWEKGQPFSRFLDSAKRHLECFHMGWTDEDHLAQAAWNIFAIMHFQELGNTDLDDMPHYQNGPNADRAAKMLDLCKRMAATTTRPGEAR